MKLAEGMLMEVVVVVTTADGDEGDEGDEGDGGDSVAEVELRFMVIRR